MLNTKHTLKLRPIRKTGRDFSFSAHSEPVKFNRRMSRNSVYACFLPPSSWYPSNDDWLFTTTCLCLLFLQSLSGSQFLWISPICS